ncbi:MAG: toll/interleukin-1 receptor domain-containing protein [Xanthobacteraceae bacterium]|jgi:hypothetical protein
MFIRNTQGTYLAGHWYGFSSANKLVTGKWLIVKHGIDPQPIAKEIYGIKFAEAIARSSEVGFKGPAKRKVFINYRRSDSLPTAIAVQRALSQELGDANVFIDLQSISGGSDFHDRIEVEIGSCDTVLVLIGNHWLQSKDDNGRFRIQQDDDYVRLEIRSALAQPTTTVLPVLIDGAEMPTKEQLPSDLERLARIQAVPLRNVEFENDIERIYGKVLKPRRKI